MTDIDSLRLDLYGNGYDLSSFKVSKMVGSSLKTMNVKIPHVKEVIKKYRFENITLDEIPLNESVELSMCFFALSLLRCKSVIEQLEFLDRYVEFSSSWMITDFIVQYVYKMPFEEYLPFFKRFLKSKKEYKMRFAYVEMLKYYKEAKLSLFERYLVDDEHYYVYMALSWLLATFAINDEEGVYQYLKVGKASKKVRQKTISKIVDSYRISLDSKARFKELRNL